MKRISKYCTVRYFTIDTFFDTLMSIGAMLKYDYVCVMSTTKKDMSPLHLLWKINC